MIHHIFHHDDHQNFITRGFVGAPTVAAPFPTMVDDPPGLRASLGRGRWLGQLPSGAELRGEFGSRGDLGIYG